MSSSNGDFEREVVALDTLLARRQRARARARERSFCVVVNAVSASARFRCDRAHFTCAFVRALSAIVALARRRRLCERFNRVRASTTTRRHHCLHVRRRERDGAPTIVCF